MGGRIKYSQKIFKKKYYLARSLEIRLSSSLRSIPIEYLTNVNMISK
ncbi:hypothetical protein C943_03516 [Mariniradius saccharolyticus AK6]|uniref:Uncharacterized protein n=1 Tax=Mariniradius saccharolyticus AK6 TaxID=1239962 RepID=M7Y0P3_9BACT|nr:hypothetical protein C943_03516 [Mariniradius saccharolyticus AK6]